MNNTQRIKLRIYNLLDDIENLLVNNTKIQSELFKVLRDLDGQSPSQTELEDILGIKVYLGSNFTDNKKIIIGEEVKSIAEDIEYIGANSTIVQDCAGNLITIELTPEQLEQQYIHSTDELWR